MVKATLLGNAGSKPTLGRALAACALQINGKVVLIDCGEGTQVSLLKTGVNCYDVSVICLTHMHGDHTLGLPGLLASIDQLVKCDSVDRGRKDVVIVAPASCKPVVEAVRSMVSLSRLSLHCVWLYDETESLEFEDFYVKAYKVRHSVDCYGYCVVEKDLPHFSSEKAGMCRLESGSWGFLQKGYVVISDRELYTVNDITDGKVSPVKIAYVTDTLPCPAIQECIKDADLAILEGMYVCAADRPKHIVTEHLTFIDAAKAARNAGVKRLWLTHFSQTLSRPKDGLRKIRNIFNKAVCGYQGLSLELMAVKDKAV